MCTEIQWLAQMLGCTPTERKAKHPERNGAKTSPVSEAKCRVLDVGNLLVSPKATFKRCICSARMWWKSAKQQKSVQWKQRKQWSGQCLNLLNCIPSVITTHMGELLISQIRYSEFYDFLAFIRWQYIFVFAFLIVHSLYKVFLFFLFFYFILFFFNCTTYKWRTTGKAVENNSAPGY